MIEIDLGVEALLPKEFVDESTYINYQVNRDACPDVEAERWRKVYGPDVDWMEPRYLRYREREEERAEKVEQRRFEARPEDYR